jgi:hypothetical protein
MSQDKEQKMEYGTTPCGHPGRSRLTPSPTGQERSQSLQDHPVSLFPIHGTDIPDHTEDACVSCHAQLSTMGGANRVPAYGDKK